MRLVICADGTWNTPHARGELVERGARRLYSSNVVKFASAVLSRDGEGRPQVVCYQLGLGTLAGTLDHLTGGTFGLGITRNIMDLYLFLANNYLPGDELYLLGFSRGAYTVRSLAGLVRNCGILRKEHLGRCGDAYWLYRDRTRGTHPSSPRARAFRATYAWPDADLHFLGVWDTVGALGIPLTPLRFWEKRLFEFHDVSLSSHVRFAYQALAIDEHRRPFRPALWTQQPDAPATQVLEQRWFPGAHRNVGGGFRDSGLSDGSLAWMCAQAEAAGLALDPALRPVPDPCGLLQDSMSWKFRILGPINRTLGQSNPLGREAVAPEALARRERLRTYRPANLETFLG
jgi:uncharacterized protein (DUF2235 family)